MSKEKNPKVPKLAEGGPMPGGAPALGADATQAIAPEAGPQDQVMALLEQYAQTKDAELAIQIADMMIAEMGIDASQDPSVQEQPVNPPPLAGAGGTAEQVPAFSKGGRLSALEQYAASKKK